MNLYGLHQEVVLLPTLQQYEFRAEQIIRTNNAIITNL